MEIKTIEDLEKGDVIILPGLEDNEILVVTVDSIDLECYLIIPEELGGMDYSPPDPNAIMVLGTKGNVHLKIGSICVEY